MSDFDLELKKAQLEAITLIGVVALFVFLCFGLMLIYYVNKWVLMECGA